MRCIIKVTFGEFPYYKGQWRGALMFSLICACINGWVNNSEAGDLRRDRTHYDVIVMEIHWNKEPHHHNRLLFGHLQGGIYMYYTHIIFDIMMLIDGLIDKCSGFCHDCKFLCLINFCEFWLRVCGSIKVYSLSYMLFVSALYQFIGNSVHIHAAPMLLRYITSQGNPKFEVSANFSNCKFCSSSSIIGSGDYADLLCENDINN